jgi:hypothetical protein
LAWVADGAESIARTSAKAAAGAAQQDHSTPKKAQPEMRVADREVARKSAS